MRTIPLTVNALGRSPIPGTYLGVAMIVVPRQTHIDSAHVSTDLVRMPISKV
jgi:hypothetical protein